MKYLIIFCLFSPFLFLIPNHLLAQDIQKTFNKGLMLEEGEGKLEQAINIYESIVDNQDAERSIKAKALMHIGMCHEKLGNHNATLAYKQILSAYSDQQEVVLIVRERLKKLKPVIDEPGSKGIIASQLPFFDEDIYGVSPDGKYVNLIDWCSIQLIVKDIKSGEVVWESEMGSWKDPYKFPDISIWSPDSKRIAYFWFIGEETELHIANIDGTEDVVLEKGHHSFWPTGWTPDGKNLICITSDESSHPTHSKHHLGKYNVDTRSFEILKTYEDFQIQPKMEVSPDNSVLLYSMKPKEGNEPVDLFLLTLDGKIDKKLISSQGDDRSPTWHPDGKQILFVSNRYGTNDLWKLTLLKDYQTSSPEMIKSHLGNEVFLFRVDNKDNLYYRSTDNRVDMHFLNLKVDAYEGSSSIKLSNFDMPYNINPSISKDGNLVAYYRWDLKRDDVLGCALHLSIYDARAGNVSEINSGLYGNPRFHMHLLSWGSDNRTLLIRGIRKQDMVAGIYALDVYTKELKLIKGVPNSSRHNDYGGIGFMHMFSNDGKSIYFLSNDKKSIGKIDIATKEETIVLKDTNEIICFRVSNDESNIALSYFFENKNDLFINKIGENSKRKIANFDAGSFPDVIAWDANNQFIYFSTGVTNDLSALFRISVDGGEPELIFDFKKELPQETVLRVVYEEKTGNMAFELGKGKGNELWKLSGLFE